MIDPIDGSLNARRTLPSHSLSIAVASGPSMADVEFGYVYDFGAGEEFTARRGGGARLGDGEIRVAADAPGWRCSVSSRPSPSWALPVARGACRQGLSAARSRLDRDHGLLRGRRPIRRNAQPAPLSLGRCRRRAADRRARRAGRSPSASSRRSEAGLDLAARYPITGPPRAPARWPRSARRRRRLTEPGASLERVRVERMFATLAKPPGSHHLTKGSISMATQARKPKPPAPRNPRRNRSPSPRPLAGRPVHPPPKGGRPPRRRRP